MPFGPKEFGPLSMSQPQQENMKRLWRKSRERPTVAIGAIKTKSADLETLYQNYDLDGQKARAAIRDLNAAQMQLLDARLRLQVELRQSLTEDQFNRLRDAMEQRARRFRERPFRPDGRQARPGAHE